MRIITWNINSLRLRLDLVARLTEQFEPDLLCLQETKVPDPLFPQNELTALGYRYQIYNGVKSYNGVAMLSRTYALSRLVPIELDSLREASRHVAVELSVSGRKMRLDNFYVPAGGDRPDIETNEKFAHKLRFLNEMKIWSESVAACRLLVGDLNVAPEEHDVWSHRQLLGVVSHTPVEVDALRAIMQAGDWLDVARRFVPKTEKLYSWWSYRNRDWAKSDRGRRLDHIWADSDLNQRIRGFSILREVRDWPRPSDHVPVCVDIDE